MNNCVFEPLKVLIGVIQCYCTGNHNLACLCLLCLPFLDSLLFNLPVPRLAEELYCFYNQEQKRFQNL